MELCVFKWVSHLAVYFVLQQTYYFFLLQFNFATGSIRYYKFTRSKSFSMLGQRRKPICFCKLSRRSSFGTLPLWRRPGCEARTAKRLHFFQFTCPTDNPASTERKRMQHHNDLTDHLDMDWRQDILRTDCLRFVQLRRVLIFFTRVHLVIIKAASCSVSDSDNL